MTAMLAVVLGLGILAATGASAPWPSSWGEWREVRAARRLADADRAEELFRMRYRMYSEGGWRPAQPLSLCEACISAAADHGLTQPEARIHCGAACGVE
jgi:hypothetical protein